MKKLPSQVSTEELLAAINQPKEETSEPKIETTDTILAFINFYNIKQGRSKVKSSLLYKLYRRYTKEPLERGSFGVNLGLYFKRHGEFFLISIDALNLSQKAQDILEKKKKDRVKSLAWRAHFEKFLERYNLKQTNEQYVWVLDKDLYKTYTQWIYEINRVNKMNFKVFIKMCRIYFTTKKTKDGYYCKLNPEMTSGIEARNSLTNEKEEPT